MFITCAHQAHCCRLLCHAKSMIPIWACMPLQMNPCKRNPCTCKGRDSHCPHQACAPTLLHLPDPSAPKKQCCIKHENTSHNDSCATSRLPYQAHAGSVPAQRAAPQSSSSPVPHCANQIGELHLHTASQLLAVHPSTVGDWNCRALNLPITGRTAKLVTGAAGTCSCCHSNRLPVVLLDLDRDTIVHAL